MEVYKDQTTGTVFSIISPRLKAHSPGDEVMHSSQDVVFIGWSTDEADHRWSSETTSEVEFLSKQDSIYRGELCLKAASYGKQRVNILLNNHNFYQAELDGNVEMSIPFDPSLIVPGKNVLVFKLPDARKPDNDDPRTIALSLYSFSLK
jgi:hypothetical protein